MKYCTECGEAINITDKFCSYCGGPVANHDISNQSNLDKPTKVKVDKTPIKSNEDSTVHIDEDGIPFNSKDAAKTFESDLINEDVSSKNHKVTQSNHIKFEIKQFIWLIILLVSMLILISKAQNIPNLNPNTTTLNFLEYALGQIAGMVVADGLIVTAIVGAVSIKFGEKKWQWYDWLNMLAYITLTIQLLGSFL